MVVPVLLCNRSRQAGYERYRRHFARLIWQLASPAGELRDKAAKKIDDMRGERPNNNRNAAATDGSENLKQDVVCLGPFICFR